MSALPATVRPCIDEAMARSPRLVAHVVDHAVAALEEEVRRRESTAERQDMGAAARELNRMRMEWCARFPQALRKTMQSANAPPTISLRPSSLTLVDDGQLMQSIESSRLTQQLASMVEQPLAELDALMSSALGLEGIQPEQNPLRPEIFAQALRTMMEEARPEPGRPALWMRYMADPLAQELSELYRASARLLVQARVQAASYRMVTGPAPLGPRASQPAALDSQPASLDPPSRPASGYGALSGAQALSSGLAGLTDRVMQTLRGPRFKDFLFRSGGGPQAQQALAPSYYARIEQELAALEAAPEEAAHGAGQAGQYEHVPVVERPVREVGTRSPLSTEVWGEYAGVRQRSLVRTQLKKKAQRIGQAMGLEVVQQLLDQVARDPRLLAPVREAMVALEPSLLRLAFESPQFFGDDQHPARRLLERVADRSFKYNDEFSSPFQDFFASVSAQFNAINALADVKDAGPFERALGQLEAGWSEQDRAEEEHRRQLMEAVQFADRRQAQAAQIAWELGHRSDLEGVPAVVQDFIYGPWALVVAHARLQNSRGELDPGGYLGAISDLLWSVKRETTLREPQRAFEVIPRVLIKLRAGLDLIGQPPADSENLFKALERLHRPVLKLRARHRRQSLESGVGEWPEDQDLQPVARQTPAPAEELWLAPGELEACGFEDTRPTDCAELGPQEEDARQPTPAAPAVQAPPAPDLPEAQAQALIAGLREGSWVDLYSRQRWRRARLLWLGTKGTLFMFVSHGNRPHSMTLRSLQRLVVSRHLRPIEGHEVVQHAIDVLAQPENQPLAA